MDNENEKSGVGYKRPPTHSRFKPGVSGNPGGRPKRRPNFRDLLLDELGAPTQIAAETGMCKLQAVIKRLVDAAIAGDGRAQTLLLNAIARFGESDEEEESLSPDDRELLQTYVQGKPAGQK
jgi:hypothetical protein